MPSKRDPNEFSKPVKDQVARAAAYCCSMCRRSTLRPIEGSLTECHYIGTIAHISAKSKGGPRWRDEYSPAYRSSAENALFLCWNCHNVVDDKASEHIYTEDWLKALRVHHHNQARLVFDQLVPKDVTVVDGTFETSGVGEITGVTIKNASAVFKNTFSSRVSGVGKVTNLDISNEFPGGKTSFQAATSSGGVVDSLVRGASTWRCPACGYFETSGFTSTVVAGGSVGGDGNPSCRRCGTQMVRA